MELLYECCAGLDVHKKTIVACVRDARRGRVERSRRTFTTKTRDVIELFDWLTEMGVTNVAMEATGVYWMPVWKVLEGGFELLLANAAEVKNVKGRKTDVKDAEWIADLLAHGLIRASMVPSQDARDLRELTRTRKQLVRERVQHKQRIHKVLEACNIKLASVISDITGATGRAIIDALIAGERDPIKLADLMHPTMQQGKWLEIAQSLQGGVRPHDIFLLQTHVEMLDVLQGKIDRISQRIQDVMSAGFREAIHRLMTIPGVSVRVAEAILAEVGGRVSMFPTHGHLVSWAGLCPEMDESAGKRRSTRVRKGAPWLKPELVQAAWAAVRKPNSYLRARFHRLKARRGPKKALIAIAAKILIAAYYILRDGVEYVDLGGEYYDNHDRERTARRLLARLQNLGYDAELRDARSAA